MLHMDISRDQYKWVLIVVWLHDVADHKYDKDGTLQIKLVEFVNSIEPDPIIANYLVQCVDMVSFSNETKGGYKYYEKILPLSGLLFAISLAIPTSLRPSVSWVLSDASSMPKKSLRRNSQTNSYSSMYGIIRRRNCFI